jgi:hypothetical protein
MFFEKKFGIKIIEFKGKKILNNKTSFLLKHTHFGMIFATP